MVRNVKPPHDMF